MTNDDAPASAGDVVREPVVKPDTTSDRTDTKAKAQMMNRVVLPLWIVATGSFFSVPAGAATPAAALPCASTQIAKVVMPTGPSRVAGGRMTLANGAVLELSGPPKGTDMYRVSQMRAGDRVATCYSGLTWYADAGMSRTLTIVDLRNGQYYGTLIGTWPGGATSH